MGKYFGTDGIRGTFGDPCINGEFAFRMGAALATLLPEGARVMLGRDTRQSGRELCGALTAGLSRGGVAVDDLGVVPTPAVAGAVLRDAAAMGIAVTASHNPASDNGIKLFDGQGCKLTPEQELEIEAAIDVQAAPSEAMPDTVSDSQDCKEHYITAVHGIFDANLMQGLKVVLDTANGATYATSPAVFEALGAEVVLLGANPDGLNINLGVGSEHPDLLATTVLEHKADYGIAHDGDGDRLVICDSEGLVLDGDVLLGILGLHALETNRLGAQTLVATVQSNLGLDYAIKEAGGKIVRTDVGDRNVASKMRELGATLGGENSGHIILSDYASTGDGLLAALELMRVLRESGKPLEDWRGRVELFPQATRNLRLAEKLPLEGLASLQASRVAVERDFGEAGRVLIRYSGTEPKLRLLVEGRDPVAVEAAMEALVRGAREDLEVLD
ncbi:MAG: phosphoglucosamine mutase [Verrucomicrobia bacterium]|nr:phosphoglucosamine mutase [Verrucomicrobiota bacterium]